MSASATDEAARLVGILETAIGRAHQSNRLFVQITEDSVNAILSPLRGVAALEAENARLRGALSDAQKRLRGAGMLGGADDPVNKALEAQEPSEGGRSR